MRGITNKLILLVADMGKITDAGLAQQTGEKRGIVNERLKPVIRLGFVEFSPPFYQITKLGLLRAGEIAAQERRNATRYRPSKRAS